MRTSISIFMLVAILCSSCSLLPGKKEFFQTKVPAYPERTVKQEEHIKQGVAMVKDKIDVAYTEGIKADVTNSVMQPLEEARTLIDPVAQVIGPPENEWKKSSTNLASTISSDQAVFQRKLESLESKLQDVEGKKIEGTGLIQISYISYILIVFIFLAVLYFVLRIVSVFNPPVAVGMKVASVGSSLVKKGFSEIVNAGEYFKELINKKIEDPATIETIKELFRQAHETKQSPEVQNVIKELTRK